MRRAIAEYRILGVKTTLPFFERVLRDSHFVAGDFDTSFVESAFAQSDRARERPYDVALAAAALRAFRDREKARLRPRVESNGASAWWRAGLREAHRTRP
jgi:acetyl-CoA carboxylase biotin carboxylase subunit